MKAEPSKKLKFPKELIEKILKAKPRGTCYW